MNAKLETEAGELTARILEMARERAADPVAFIMAMSDSIGITAALLDKTNLQSIDDRLVPVNVRIKNKYQQVSGRQLVIAGHAYYNNALVK